MGIIIGVLITILIFGITILRLHSVNLSSLRLSDLKKENIKNILFIYPHPDDESMVSGGMIAQVARDKDFNIFVVDITKGDRGDELLKLPPEELGKVRELEYNKALKILGVSNPEIWDFPDGSVPANENDLKKRIIEYIEENKIDLVVTFERWGIYGHQDHVALSKVVNEVVTEKDIKVLYSTISPKIAKVMNLKQYISGLDLHDFESNELPEMKLPIWGEIIRQYRAVRNYKSQNLSHKYPLWVTILMNPYEYYTTKFKPE